MNLRNNIGGDYLKMMKTYCLILEIIKIINFHQKNIYIMYLIKFF
jgi:hypothetical protein